MRGGGGGGSGFRSFSTGSFPGDGEIVFFERDDKGDEFCEEVGEEKAYDYGLQKLLPLSHGEFLEKKPNLDAQRNPKFMKI